MQLINKFNTGIHYSLCIGDMNQTKNKIWEDTGSELYNRSMKSWSDKMLNKFIQHRMRENLLFLKDSLKP